YRQSMPPSVPTQDDAKFNLTNESGTANIRLPTSRLFVRPQSNESSWQAPDPNQAGAFYCLRQFCSPYVLFCSCNPFSKHLKVICGLRLVLGIYSPHRKSEYGRQDNHVQGTVKCELLKYQMSLFRPLVTPQRLGGGRLP